MKTWYTARELAGLPGMPKREKDIPRLARRKDWQSRTRKGRGGGREYHIDSLPEQARAALARRAVAERPPGGWEPGSSADDSVSSLSSRGMPSEVDPALAISALRDDQVAGVAEARLEILDLFDRYVAAGRLQLVPAADVFARLYSAGEVAASEPTRRVISTFGGSTLLRWRRARTRAGLNGLVHKYGRHRKGRGRIESDEEMRELIVGVLAHRPHVSAKQVMRDLRARFRDTPERIPGYRTVQRFITNWKTDNASVFEAISDPDAWRSRRRVAYGSASEKVARLNQLWEMDSTLAEVMLQDGRHALVACIDIFSRRAKLLVTRTSASAAILSLLRRCCMDWGVPESVKTDNGKDYVSAQTVRALRGLGIDHHTCTPFSPEQKPHVERFIGTVVRGLFEQLPGYIGHNVAERKAIESRRSFAERFGSGDRLIGALPLTAAELQAACDDWVAGIYEHERHGGLNGRSPFEAAATWAGAARRVENERALDVLLAEAPGTHGIRTVQKKGIAVEGTHFIAPELGAYDDGRKVHVRLDPIDMGRIYVFDVDTSAFICEAVAPERTGDSREEKAREAKVVQKAKLAAAKKEIEAIKRRARPHDLYKEGIALARDEAARVAAFPRPTEPHLTPALNEASKAVSPRPKDYEPSPEEMEAAQARVVSMEEEMAARRAAERAEEERLRARARELAERYERRG